MRTLAHRRAFRSCQAMFLCEVLIQAGGISGHWTIEVDRNIRDKPVAFQFVQVVHQQLRAPDSKRRNQRDTVAQTCLVDHLRQVLLGRLRGM
ncbi:hypothetical protein D9M71_772360 [compost metagenome]